MTALTTTTPHGKETTMQRVQQDAQEAEQHARPFLNFKQKVTNDWAPQLASMLAYTFLTSIFPLMLVILAVGGFVLGAISPSSTQQLYDTIQHALPSGIGSEVVSGALKNLNRSAGLVLIIGVVGALFSGSRLFIAIENASGIIFRLRGRDGLHQNVMAIGMTLLYVLLVPLIFVASVIPDKLLSLVGWQTHVGFGGLVAEALGIVVSVIVAFVLFIAIYVVVPNRPVTWKEAWRGALFTAVLLVLYELLFPLYTTYLLKPGNYGSLAGFALVILAFFYYLALILLLGMEINSWLSGQRQTAGDLAAIVHEVQAHDSTRGAAGPTAGTIQEDQQNHKGAAVMRTAQSAIEHERRDHHADVKPPKFAEANKQEAQAGNGKGGLSAPTPSPADRTKSQAVQHPSLRGDAQRLLLAALVVGTGKVASVTFSRLRQRNAAKTNAPPNK